MKMLVKNAKIQVAWYGDMTNDKLKIFFESAGFKVLSIDVDEDELSYYDWAAIVEVAELNINLIISNHGEDIDLEILDEMPPLECVLSVIDWDDEE